MEHRTGVGLLSEWPKIVALTVDHVFDVADTLYSAGDFIGEVAELEKLRTLWLAIDEKTLLDAIVHRLSDYRRNLHPDTVAAQIVRLKREVFSAAHRASGSLAAARALGLLLAQPPIADRVSALPFLEAAYSQNPDDKEVVFEFSQCCVAARKYDEAIQLLRSDAYGDPGNEGKFMTYVDLLRLLDRAETEKQYLAGQLANARIEQRDEYCIQYAFLCRSLGTSQEVLERFHGISEGQRSSAVLVAIGLAFEDLNRQQEASAAFREAEHAPNACRFAAHFANRVTDDLNHTSRMLAIAEARAKNIEKPRAAIMISGLVRDYRFAYGLRQFIERCEGWTIDLFAHMFDRLGDLRIPGGMPKELYDHTNSGVYREIQKTAPLDVEKFVKFFQPTRWVVQPRKEDGYYIDRIGMDHPQWLKVYDCFQLLEEHVAETGTHYDLVIRARADTTYDKIKIDKEKIVDNTVVTPGNHRYGTPGFVICDRFAYSTHKAMEIYCSIGKGKNFVELDNEEFWQQNLREHTRSHEIHVAYWLKKNGIEIRVDPEMTI
jgi:hypothetical protein